MALDTAQARLEQEFRDWNVPFQTRPTGSGHVEFTWQLYGRQPRKTIVASTASDHRSHLNNRAEVRRLWRADGLVEKPIKVRPEKKQPSLQKALSLPEPVETDREIISALRDEVRSLRGELDAVSGIALEMGNMLAEIRAGLGSMFAPTLPPPATIDSDPFDTAPKPTPPKPVVVVPEARSVRSVKAIDFLSAGWSSIDALARDMGLSVEVAYRKLYYLLKQGEAEQQGRRWRLKAAEQQEAA